MGNWEWGIGNIPFFPFALQKKLLRLSQQFSKKGRAWQLPQKKSQTRFFANRVSGG